MENRYLEKIAKDTDDKKVGNLGKFGIHTGIATVANGIGFRVADAGMNAILRDSDHKSQADKYTLKHMIKDHKLNVTFNPNKLKSHTKGIEEAVHQGAVHSQTEPAYLHTQDWFKGKKNFISGKKSNIFKHVHNALAHEVGHAVDFKNGSKLKIALDAGSRRLQYGRHGRALGELATVVAGTNEKTRKYAPVVPLVLAAPMIRSELAANYHATKGILKHKGAEEASKFIRKLAIPNTINYTSRPIALAAGVYGANKIIDHINKKRQNGK